MSMEPERPIEKLLRAWAKKRRDDAGGPFEMHPATRRLLQGEVSRRFGKATSQSRSSSQFLVRLWPRMAWATVVAALMSVMAMIIVPALKEKKDTTTLASDERRLVARTE